MTRMDQLIGVIALTAAIGLSGCASQDSPAEPSAAGSTSIGSTDPDVAAALAQLSAEDRMEAEKQHVCPVTDEPLGSMGKPVKVTVSGRDLFLCCEGCRDTVTSDPEKYLAKLK